MCNPTASGLLEERDFASAAAYFKKATDVAQADALRRFCEFLIEERISMFDVEAVEYIRRAAALGQGPSQVAYGLCLLRGAGVARDEAADSFRVADRGDAFGQLNRVVVLHPRYG